MTLAFHAKFLACVPHVLPVAGQKVARREIIYERKRGISAEACRHASAHPRCTQRIGRFLVDLRTYLFEFVRPFFSNSWPGNFSYAKGHSGSSTDSHQCFSVQARLSRMASAPGSSYNKGAHDAARTTTASTCTASPRPPMEQKGAAGCRLLLAMLALPLQRCRKPSINKLVRSRTGHPKCHQKLALESAPSLVEALSRRRAYRHCRVPSRLSEEREWFITKEKWDTSRWCLFPNSM